MSDLSECVCVGGGNRLWAWTDVWNEGEFRES